MNNEERYLAGGKPGNKRILIVDDDLSVCDALYSIAHKEGFLVEQASDGEEGLEKAKLLYPALIILDLILPKNSGFEILRDLRAGDTRDIPVVLISGRRMDQSTLETLKRETSVKEFLEKPVKAQVLASLLHSLLKTRPHGKIMKK